MLKYLIAWLCGALITYSAFWISMRNVPYCTDLDPRIEQIPWILMCWPYEVYQCIRHIVRHWND